MGMQLFRDVWVELLAAGVVVIIVSIFRAIFGKPKLAFMFEVVDTGKAQVLSCKLWNSPFRHWVMKMLFVPRPRIDSITVQCEILVRDEHMRRIGNPFLALMRTIENEEPKKRLSLPASIHPAIFSILILPKGFRIALPPNAKVGDVGFTGGPYVAQVTACYGDKKAMVLQELIITDKIILGVRLEKVGNV